MRKVLFFILTLLAGVALAGDFKFAVLGDSQLQNPRVFEGIVQEVNLLKPDFVIHVGDMIEGYTYDPVRIREEWEGFKRQIAPLTMPFYPVAGNHDVVTTPLQALFAEVWGKDRLYYSFDHKGSHFVVLNTDYNLNYGMVTAEQLAWLDRDLQKSARADHAFIFMHRPLWRDVRSNWSDVRTILKKYTNISAVIAGHAHKYYFEEVDGLRCFIINSSAQMSYSAPEVGYFHQFLYVSVNGEEVTEAVIPADGVKPADYVTREEFDRAAPYFQSASGGQIPDPAESPLNIIYTFPVKNRTEEMNAYTVRWETPNPAFIVEPREQVVLISPGRTEDVAVRIKSPSRHFEAYSLPYALIQTYYNTLRGDSVVLTSRHELCIPPKSVVHYTKTSPTIDGILDDTAWQSADIITNFQVNRGGDMAVQQTWARTLYDDGYFYIGIHCAEPEPDKVVTLASPPVSFTWGDDEVEVFIDATHEMKTYSRASINAAGTTFNYLAGKGNVPPWYNHAVHRGKDYWSVECRMPLAAIGQDDAPTSATLWGFNVRRNRQRPQKEESDWNKMTTFPCEPWRFGVLRFER